MVSIHGVDSRGSRARFKRALLLRLEHVLDRSWQRMLAPLATPPRRKGRLAYLPLRARNGYRSSNRYSDASRRAR
jgi:hypothetical protein